MSGDIDYMAMLIQAATIATAIADEVAGTPSATGVAGLQIVNEAAEIYKLYRSKPGLKPNYQFVTHGHDGDSPITLRYFKARRLKNMGAAAASIAGTVSSSHTAGVSVPGIATGVNASVTSALHAGKIMTIAKHYKQSRTIADWCATIEKAKLQKLGLRAGGAIASSVPIPMASMVGSVVIAAATAKVQLTQGSLLLAAAGDIHWRAFQERAIGGKSASGPGILIVRELFAKRGATAMLGSYDVDAIISEPAGWNAINDKLTLI